MGAPFDEVDSRSVYLAVFDVDGYRSGVVKMAMDRSAVQSATTDLRTMALVALVLAVLAATVAALLLSRYISRPLARLAAAAVAIAEGETRQSIAVSGGDEIARLAGAFNRMSERVTERVTDLSDKLSSLTAEMDELTVVFGHTLLDKVDLDVELEHMLPGVAGMMKADAACLFLQSDAGLAPTSASATCASDVAAALATRAVAGGMVVQGDTGNDHLAAAPLSRGDTRGALVVMRSSVAFDEEETALLGMLAGQVAVAVGNADTWQRLEAGYLTTVAALAGAIEVKDEYPQTHPRAVADVCDAARRGAQVRSSRPAPAALRRDPARHRQDRCARAHPSQGGAAQRRGVLGHRRAHTARREHRLGDRLPEPGGARHPRSP